MMMNIEHAARGPRAESSPGKTNSIIEYADNIKKKAMIKNFEEFDMLVDGETVAQVLEESFLFNLELSGVKNFLNIS